MPIKIPLHTNISACVISHYRKSESYYQAYCHNLSRDTPSATSDDDRYNHKIQFNIFDYNLCSHHSGQDRHTTVEDYFPKHFLYVIDFPAIVRSNRCLDTLVEQKINYYRPIIQKLRRAKTRAGQPFRLIINLNQCNLPRNAEFSPLFTSKIIKDIAIALDAYAVVETSLELHNHKFQYVNIDSLIECCVDANFLLQWQKPIQDKMQRHFETWCQRQLPLQQWMFNSEQANLEHYRQSAQYKDDCREATRSYRADLPENRERLASDSEKLIYITLAGERQHIAREKTMAIIQWEQVWNNPNSDFSLHPALRAEFHAAGARANYSVNPKTVAVCKQTEPTKYTCIICFDAEVERGLLHENGVVHNVVCARCARVLLRGRHRCPICRQAVTKIVKVFNS